jgi:hypothetical protein
MCEEHGFFLIAPLTAAGDLQKVMLDPGEHTDYEWVRPSSAGQRLGFSSNRRMLKILRERLRGTRKTKKPTEGK